MYSASRRCLVDTQQWLTTVEVTEFFWAVRNNLGHFPYHFNYFLRYSFWEHGLASKIQIILIPLCWQLGTIRGASKLVLDGRAVVDVELENIFSPTRLLPQSAHRYHTGSFWEFRAYGFQGRTLFGAQLKLSPKVHSSIVSTGPYE